MVTRNLMCHSCQKGIERTALGMHEPSHACPGCGEPMELMPTFPAGVKLVGPGFHHVDYPKSAAQLKKDYGLDKHDSCDEDSDYNQPGYKEHMADGQDI